MVKIKESFTVLKKYWKSIILYVVFLIIMFFMISQKENYHLDEFLTLNLANAEEWINPEDGVKYEPVSEFYANSLAASGTVDFSHVWKQQSNDTHPPFYYALIHLACSLFPGTISKRALWIVNVAFQLLILFFFRKILDEFEVGEKYKNLFSLAYILCGGVHAITTFFRMYVMLTFFITLFTYLILRCIKKITPVLLVEICITTVCGTLTQYYFLLYAFAICAILFIYLVIKKRWAEVILFSTTMALGLLASYFIFPSILKHLFLGERGTQSLANLGDTTLFLRLKDYLGFLSNNLFGGLLSLLVGVIVSLLIARLLDRYTKSGFNFVKMEGEAIRLVFLLIPLLFYLVVVVKSSPLVTSRYISPIYPIALILILVLIKFSVDYWEKDTKRVFWVCLVVVGIIISCGMAKACWNEFLYPGSDARKEWAESNAQNTEAICFYNSSWDINTIYLEAIRCKSMTFYNIYNYGEFLDKVDIGEYGDEIAFFMLGTADPDGFINQFLQDYPEFELRRDNGQFNNVGGKSFYLWKKVSNEQ